MRRLAAVLTFVGFTLGLVALPATALAQTTSPTTPQGSGPGPNPQVSGPFTGTSTFNTPFCESFGYTQVFDGTYTINSGRTGSFHLDECLSLVTFEWSGTFTLTGPNGATMNGTAAGALGTIGTNGASFSITLTPTGGTQQFANVGGVINLTGTWQSSRVPGVPGPISGSLAGALTH